MFKAWYNSPRALGFSTIASKEAEVNTEHPETSRQGEDSRWSPEYRLKGALGSTLDWKPIDQGPDASPY